MEMVHWSFWKSLRCFWLQLKYGLIAVSCVSIKHSDSKCCCMGALQNSTYIEVKNASASKHSLCCLPTGLILSWESLSRNLEKILLNRNSAPNAEKTVLQQRESSKDGQVILWLTDCRYLGGRDQLFPAQPGERKDVQESWTCLCLLLI